MIDFGTVKPGATLYVPFASFAGATGASITLTGLAVTDIEIYKNGSTTQRASDTGYALLDTDGIDVDGTTGIHGFSIDLASNADAGFFGAGADYFVVVSSVTIDGQTVNFVAARFRIGYADALLDTTIATLSSQTSFTLTAGPTEDDALNGCVVLIHDIASAVQLGWAVIADYTGSTKTVTLAAGVTFTAAAGDNVSLFLPRLLPTVAGRTLAVGSSGGTTVDSLAAASISSSTFAAGAITASVLATDCITSDEIATSAATEISAGITLSAAETNVATYGTCQAGSTSTTLVLASGASSVNSSYLGLEVYIHTGTGLGQARTITAYVGATRTATVDRAWEVTPDNTSQYAVRPWRSAALDTVGRGLLGSAGVDAIIVDATDGAVNLRQAAGIILSTSAGVVDGAELAVPGPIQFYAADGSTVIVSAQHDGRGNRTAVVWTPPA